jgi:hypothetical protein
MYIPSRLARAFFKGEENIFDFQTHQATHGVVNVYNAGVVTHNRRIGSRNPSRMDVGQV